MLGGLAVSVRRALFKLHHAVGVAAAAVLLLTSVTGAVLVFRDSFKDGPPPRAPVWRRRWRSRR
jgi:uncharacterized iron-regulated membrane protein